MAYVSPNFPTKAALKRAVKAGDRVTVFQPNADVTGFDMPVHDGRVSVEGPHYPEPHRWYGTVEVNADNVVTRVVG